MKKNNNDFIKGMEAGARPFEKEFDKIDKNMKDLNEDFSKYKKTTGDVIDAVIDEVEQKDNLFNFGFTGQCLKDKLDKYARQRIIGCLFAISQLELSNNSQKRYLNNLRLYLECDTTQVLDLDTMENVEDLSERKILLNCIMELLFLNCESFIFLDSDRYKDIFDYFSKKEIAKAFSNVKLLFDTIGIEGIVSKYQFINLDEQEKKSEQQKRETIANEKKEKGIVEIIDEKIFDISSRVNGIKSWNQLIFINCEITYEACKTDHNVTVNDNHVLLFDNCTFHCDINNCYNSKSIEIRNYLIILQSNSQVTFKDCTIYEGFALVGGYKDAKVSIIDSYIENPKKEFVRCKEIHLENIHMFINSPVRKELYRDAIFEVNNGDVNNCIFETDYYGKFLDAKYCDNPGINDILFSYNSHIIINDSKFIGIYGVNAKKILFSSFINCMKISFEEISKCTFKECYEVGSRNYGIIDYNIIKNSYFEQCDSVEVDKLTCCLVYTCFRISTDSIQKCYFYKCDNNLFGNLSQLNASDCIFYNITSDKPNSSGLISTIGDIIRCKFILCKLSDDYIISARNIYEKEEYSYYKLKVSNCEFINCSVNKRFINQNNAIIYTLDMGESKIKKLYRKLSNKHLTCGFSVPVGEIKVTEVSNIREIVDPNYQFMFDLEKVRDELELPH